MKKLLASSWFYQIYAAVGVLCMVLQWLYFDSEDEKGLLIRGHWAAIAGGILIVLALAAAIYVGCDRKFPQLPAKLRAVGGLLGVLGVGISAITMLLRGEWITAAAAVMCALAVAHIALCRYRRTRSNFLAYGVGAVFLMIYLISHYQMWSAEPETGRYALRLLALVFLMLAFYQKAALGAGVGNSGAHHVFSAMGMMLSFGAIPGAQHPLLFAGMGCWLLLDPTVRVRKRKNGRCPMKLPENIRFCIDRLEHAGFAAYVVGGCVRDALLGLTPHDYDICTAATPEQMQDLFADHPLVLNGLKHGTVSVVVDHELVEITTFRTEGEYLDNRHPQWVRFVDRVEEDLARRDFTVNAMAYSPSRGFADPFGGRLDLEKGVLRAVGDPAQRFREDALRILRGVRFSVRYGLQVEEKTQQAMFSLVNLMDHLARERVFDELCKLLPHVKAADLLRFAPVLVQVVPELAPSLGFDQRSPHHAYDVYTHTAYVVEQVPPKLHLRWAALLHDTGKPRVFYTDENGRGHFPGHAGESAELADQALRRLRAPNDLRILVRDLVARHMMLPTEDRKIMRRRMSKFGADYMEDLLVLQQADFDSKGVGEQTDMFRAAREEMAQIKQEQACLSLKDLAVNGRDLMELGFAPGRHIGVCLNWLLEQVLEEQCPNDREILLEAAKRYLMEGIQ